MMDAFNHLKSELLAVDRDLESLVETISSMPELDVQSFEDWRRTLSGIRQQLAEDVIRVAVVGAIKSGKSTFVNSLLGDDFLKRGAGVVTSIVTRIRSGRWLRARLYFKSWDEINADIEEAMVLFPALNRPDEDGGFDMRREKDRSALQEALSTLGVERLIQNDSRDANSVLLFSYLKGYPEVQHLIGSEPVLHDFEGERFPEHRLFAGADFMAVYLKDIELEIGDAGLDDNVELADCQGSDSPNPAHLSMIQDYLLRTHFIIYVISSRTGLRQADIKFLSIIGRMGILDNMLFVVNSDLDEHESLEDLEALVENVRDELSLIRPEPHVFSFSALYNLFRIQQGRLSERESLRLEHWEKAAALTRFSDEETARFQEEFKRKLTAERMSLFMSNNLERLRVIGDGLGRWLRVRRDLLSQDSSGAAQIVDRIRLHQERMDQVRSMIKSTLDGSVGKLKTELRRELDRFFDPSRGSLLPGVFDFAHRYAPPLADYEKNLESAGFTPTLYLLFQDFRQAVNGYLAETVNPEVVGFILRLEARIRSSLQSVARPYDAMIQEALAEHDRSLKRFGVHVGEERQESVQMPDMETIRNRAGLSMPPAVAHLRYSARIRTEAVMRFGFYSVLKAFKKILKKPISSPREEGVQALRDGLRRIKRETERSLRFHFKDYGENIKFQYVFRLTDAASNALYETILDEFGAYVSDLDRMAEMVGRERHIQQKTAEILGRLAADARDATKRIERLRAAMEPELSASVSTG
ncbi:MAG: dynamin family protein [Desulfobacterales bacterium]|nr:dynamin family protein [Desulfobacterales bacterium]